MPVKLNPNSQGKLLEVDVSGKLSHEDYQTFVPVFEKRLKEHGKLRVLFITEAFSGWEMSAIWDAITFDAKHFSDVERVAIVGDRHWEEKMSQFCRAFTTAKIRCFPSTQRFKARGWIEEDLEITNKPRPTPSPIA